MLRYSEALISILLAIGVFVSPICSSSSKALSVPVASDWYGFDGNWSPVSIRIGSPPQWVQVFVSTASRETWVVGPAGCDSTALCRDKRGGLFRSNTSTTWQNVGLYELGLNLQYGIRDNGLYGYDDYHIGDDVKVSNQIIGVINTTDYLLGFMGLGIQPSNFTTNAIPSLLATLAENQSHIPSPSYGYTAGAYYRPKRFPASLTLGGYDAKRFVPHDQVFGLDPDRSPVTSVNEITVSTTASGSSGPGWSANSLQLLGPAEASLFTIDSSTPFLWLPEAVCLRLERAFGLTYDNSLQLYTFEGNSSVRQKLVNWNMTFTFSLADLPNSNQLVNITLPYAAFDLQLTFPYPGLNATVASPSTRYFPLRKAANDTQYTLGRAFLQEAYLIVDYERNNFSVHQAKFAADASTKPELVDIISPSHIKTTEATPGRKGGPMHSAAIAGIVVGAVIGLITTVMAILAGLAKFYRYRGGAPPSWLPSWLQVSFDVEDGGVVGKKLSELPLSTETPLELPLSKHSPLELPLQEAKFEMAGTSHFARELDAGGEILELSGKHMDAVELPANEVVKRSPVERPERFSFEAASTEEISPVSRPHTLPSYHSEGRQSEPSVPTTPRTEVSAPSSPRTIDEPFIRSLAQRRGRHPNELRRNTQGDYETPMPSSLASALLSPTGKDFAERSE